MPAHNPMAEKALEFQYNFMKSGGVKIIIDVLAKNNFLSNTDMPTKRGFGYCQDPDMRGKSKSPRSYLHHVTVVFSF
ncbi:putative ubiquitin carboxyl-terminal hydrolase FAF-X [Portunus trituberculatus]|uniref:Putative ubiquitin carboxyl-terminal hydrolase FAF-X n=1 Tax=Portunus trituberculatus TaxID=210409 RepID=A0A5B7I8X9_PORTR|nr:putative ubiquitin carboxyl-terminal hydrolase FAF-X [Portunus trituberculatus]